MRDDETYPWILGAEAWPDLRVRNLASPGWGTVNVYLELEKILERDTPPLAVFYGYMSHAQRNYLRRAWREKTDYPFPFFELEGDKLVFKGLRPSAGATMEDSPELLDAERAVTVALIGEMDRMARRRGVPLIVLVLADGDGVIDALKARSEARIVNLENVWPDYYPNDGHPAPNWHRMVAHAICNSRRIAEETGAAALYRSGAASLDAVDRRAFYLKRVPVGGLTAAKLARVGEKRYRLDGIEGTGGDDRLLRMLRSRHRFESGTKYAARFALRCDEEREARVVVADNSPGGSTLAERKLRIGPERRDFEVPFDGKETSEGEIAFYLGNSTAPVELDFEGIIAKRGDGDEEEVLPQAQPH